MIGLMLVGGRRSIGLPAIATVAALTAVLGQATGATDASGLPAAWGRRGASVVGR